MSNTSYQRAVVDMKAAGINPILAATNGGANTPTGATGDIKSLGNSMSAGTSNAIAVSHAKEDLKVKKLQSSVSKDAMSLYQSNPEVGKLVAGAKLAQEAGLDPRYGAAFGGSKTPMAEKIMRAAKKGVKGTRNVLKQYIGDPIAEGIMAPFLNSNIQENNRKNWNDTRDIRSKIRSK